jgi:hypothetical protein
MTGRPGALLATAALCLIIGSRPPAASELRGIDTLSRIYDTILDARFDQADAELQHACPSSAAPREACDVMAATSTWWRILLDPDNQSLDTTFEAQADHAIDTTEAWSAREPDNPEAHFYTGAAYAVRVQWRVLREEKLAAARDGKRIKQALERAVDLDPALDDAYFGIGLYQYYADVAPAGAKILRFLLMLPGGDKTEGLAQMRRARAQGRLLQGEADYQLQIIYLWYEQRPDLAVELLRSLKERYPGNPLFAADLADVQDRYQHDVTASLASWRELIAAAHDRRVNEPALAEAEARLGAARQLEALYQTDHALDHLRAVIDEKPVKPYGALASAYLALGQGEDRLGHHDAAVAAYRLALSSLAGAPDPHGIRKRANEAIRHAPNPARADAYRLSLEGLRKLERGDVGDAETLLTRSLTLNADDPVARYRYGRVLLARKADTAALDAFEMAIRDARDCPGSLAASAYLEAARLHERFAHRQQAIDDYRAASTWFGAAADTRAAATRALVRLHAR